MYNNGTIDPSTPVSEEHFNTSSSFHMCFRRRGGGVVRKSAADSQSEEGQRGRHLAATIVDRVCFVLYVAIVIVCFVLFFPYP